MPFFITIRSASYEKKEYEYMAKTSTIHARTDSNHLPSPQPTTTYGISGEQLDAQLQKGMESLRSGRTYSVEEVDEELSKEFGI